MSTRSPLGSITAPGRNRERLDALSAAGVGVAAMDFADIEKVGRGRADRLGADLHDRAHAWYIENYLQSLDTSRPTGAHRRAPLPTGVGCLLTADLIIGE